MRERALLRLVDRYGVRQGEIAALLGVSRPAVRRMLRRAKRRARDPLNAAILRCWRRLTPQERQLVRLNRMMGLPLREIARLRLISLPRRRGPPTSAVGVKQLSSAIRAIKRKARRHGQWRDGHASGSSSSG